MWHAERQSCFWLDIPVGKIYEYKMLDKRLLCSDLSVMASKLVKGRNNCLVLGFKGGVGRLSLAEDVNPAALKLITDLNCNWNTHRCNDGVCDSEGDFWISTTGLAHEAAAGAVFRVSAAGIVEKKIRNVTIPNGMVWSLDKTRLFFIDSPEGTISSFYYDASTGRLRKEGVVARIPREMGLPDGMAIDAEGNVWVALYGGYGVAGIDVKTGDIVRHIAVPVPNVTSCAFAGSRLEQLVITTSKQGMNAEALKTYPESGHTFIAEPGVCGVPDYECKL
jgi:sugar lactone lactonase YvrE